MATTVTKTIGPTGDYTTLQAWEDAAPANLVTNDEVWQGVIQSGASFSGSSAMLTIAGSTSDATRYKELTVATGGAWCDNAANALRYDEAQGAYIKSTGAYVDVVTVTEPYARISRVQIRASAGGSKALIIGGTGVRAKDCIASSHTRNAIGISGAATVEDTLAHMSSTGGATANAAGLLVDGANATLNNITIACPGGGNAAKGLHLNYSTSTCRNVVAMGFTDGIYRPSNSSGTTFAACMQDTNGTSYTGVTNSVAFSTANFGNVGTGSPDLKTVSGSALIDAGNSSGSATDPFGTARPQGAAYDVGAYEYPSGGGGGSTLPVNLVAPNQVLAFRAAARRMV